MENHKSYDPDHCCSGGFCWAEWKEHEPCYGPTSVVDEEWSPDSDDYYWVHGCEGHQDAYEQYEPMEEQCTSG